MKKILVFLIVICFISGCSTNENKEVIPLYKEELLELGYSNEVIGKLEEILDVNYLEKITEYDYIDVLLDIVNDSDFKIENFEKYLKYYENGMNGSAVVYIINNDIKYIYNEKLVSIMNHKYFIANNLDRYMKYESDDIDEIVTNVNVNIDREFYTDIVGSDVSLGNLVLVNKYYKLDEDYSCDLVNMSSRYSVGSGQKINSEAYESFKSLVEDGEKAGVYIRSLSSYRSYKRQDMIYNNYLNEHGLEWTEKYSARSGHSEHQTGLAVDVVKKGVNSFDGFEETSEFNWLDDNAHLYGFILRYPEDKSYITGYSYEPWHYRYVGVDVATYIYENDITFEEYYAYFVENKNYNKEENN